jgi:hypothetical protein
MLLGGHYGTVYLVMVMVMVMVMVQIEHTGI